MHLLLEVKNITFQGKPRSFILTYGYQISVLENVQDLSYSQVVF